MTTITPERLAKLREAIAALQAAHYKMNASCFDSPLDAYIAAADPQTVLALVEEVERLRKENGKMRERLHHPCAGCPGCSSNDCPDALDVATLDMADMRSQIERMQARVAELESAMAQRMGVYAAPKDERKVGS